MSQYYLISQLPSLDGADETTKLSVTEEQFLELCTHFLSGRVLDALKNLTLVPSKKFEKTGYKVIDAWNIGERQLRLALADVRAKKMKKSFDVGNEAFSIQVLQTAREAVEMDDPMEAEKFLNRYRLNFLETLRPMDSFCDDTVFYYGLKIKLISRIQQFDRARGQDSYRKIYSSIVRGDDQEE